MTSSPSSLMRSAGLFVLGGLVGGGLIYAAEHLPLPGTLSGAHTAPVSTGETAETAGSDEAPIIIARINGEAVYKSDFDTIVSLLPDALKALPADQIFPLLQEQMVTSVLIEQTARTSGVDATDAYRARVREAEKQVLRQMYLDDVVAKAVGEEALKTAYDQMIATTTPEDEVHARHILVETPELATDLIDQLKGGADFAALAQQHSKDSSAAGGDLGYFTAGMMVKPFADAAFAMEKGAMSTAPVKTEFGYHVLQVLDRRLRPLPTFEESRAQIEADLRRKAVDDALQALRATAQVELFDLTGAPLTVQDKVDAALSTTDTQSSPTSVPVEEPGAAPDASAPTAASVPESASEPAMVPASPPAADDHGATAVPLEASPPAPDTVPAAP